MAIITIDLGPNLEGTGENPTPIKLSDKAITPGAYTNANLTVNQQGLVTAVSSGSSGSGAIEYDAGSGGLTNFWVRGGAGIVVTTSAAGVYLIDVPDGIVLERFWFEITVAGDLDGSGNMQITTRHATAGVNTSRATAKVPSFFFMDSGGNIRVPSDISITAQMTSVAAGDLVQSVNGVNGAGLPIMIIGVV